MNIKIDPLLVINGVLCKEKFFSYSEDRLFIGLRPEKNENTRPISELLDVLDKVTVLFIENSEGVVVAARVKERDNRYALTFVHNPSIELLEKAVFFKYTKETPLNLVTPDEILV